MQILEKGHIYHLDNKLNGGQILKYFKDLPNNEEGHDGVLCQEVIRSLINRMIELNNQVPCQESLEIIQKLRDCIILFETRAARRLLEKSYAKTGKHVEELPTDNRGHILTNLENSCTKS